jgi:hypothetical protein
MLTVGARLIELAVQGALVGAELLFLLRESPEAARSSPNGTGYI